MITMSSLSFLLAISVSFLAGMIACYAIASGERR
jgi:hypothetical protein